MSVVLTNAWGESVDDPTPATLQQFLDRIDPDDVEHGAAWLSADDGAALEYCGDGRLVLSVDNKADRHLSGVSKAQALSLWSAFAEGRRTLVEAQPWREGNGRPWTIKDDEFLKKSLLSSDREFYESLGPEREAVACRSAGCSRGAINFSVFCRSHHVLSVRGRLYPRDEQ